jgi:hypothetical protein
MDIKQIDVRITLTARELEDWILGVFHISFEEFRKKIEWDVRSTHTRDRNSEIMSKLFPKGIPNRKKYKTKEKRPSVNSVLKEDAKDES